MSDFTKGKWKASKTLNFTGTLVSYITCGEKNIAQTRLNDTDDTLEENEANAYLIAAAPDLYEALERTLFDLKNGFLGDSPLVSDRVGEIEKVLAKADEK